MQAKLERQQPISVIERGCYECRHFLPPDPLFLDFSILVSGLHLPADCHASLPCKRLCVRIDWQQEIKKGATKKLHAASLKLPVRKHKVELS